MSSNWVMDQESIFLFFCNKSQEIKIEARPRGLNPRADVGDYEGTWPYLQSELKKISGDLVHAPSTARGRPL